MGAISDSATPPSSQPTPPPPIPQYRSAAPLPPQLLDISTVGFEEQLYAQSLDLLTSTITTGHGTSRPAYIPPPQHLALIATLGVHPSMTTRVTSRDKHAASDAALHYLRHLQSLVGAQNADLNRAFDFANAGSSRAKRSRPMQGAAKDYDDDEPGSVRSSYARHESLFGNADDFWAVIGWALNTATAYPHRWARWHLWLSFMLDVLSQDFDARYAECVASNTLEADVNVLHGSLLAQYLAHFRDSSRNAKRRILRAVMADGSPTSLAQFPEIWRNETALPKGKGEKEGKERQSSNGNAKKRKLDLESGDFGDYYSSDSSLHSATHSTSTSTSNPTPSLRNSRSRSKKPTSPTLTPTTPFASPSPSPIPHRQRLLSLLLHASPHLPTLLSSLEDLLDLYSEALYDLPLPLFRSLISPPTPWLDPDTSASLLCMVARNVIDPAAPTYNANRLTQGDLEVYFAPWGSGRAGEEGNAKMGVLVEGMVGLLWATGGLEGGKGLVDAVGKGIRVREGKAKGKGEMGREVERGSQRIRWMVKMAGMGRAAG